MRVQPDTSATAVNVSQREPTRSFFHSSFRGHLGTRTFLRLKLTKLTLTPTAPVDTAQYARNVREDTAELASYALSDHASSVHSGSPHPSSLTQSNLESYFPLQSDEELPTPRNLNDFRPHMIQEVSEPISPEIGHPGYKSPGTSILTNMIRKSPKKASPPNEEEEQSDIEPEDEDNGRQFSQERLIVTTNGVKVDSTERTPLLKKDSSGSPHPDYIHGEPDIERQALHRKVSWPKFRKLVSWPRKKGINALRIVANPKSWDRKVIWHNAVVVPTGYLPAVILGCLLNILDALSYGKYSLLAAPIQLVY
jgi:sulfate permease, SulP family